MYTYKFTGKLEPENLIKDFNLTATITLRQPDFGINGTLDINIERTNVEVLYTSQVDHSSSISGNLETLKNYVQEITGFVIDLYGYVHSIYLDVYILEVKCVELKIDYIFGIKGERNINKSGSEAQEEFNKLFRIFTSINNFSLKDVFGDFHKAIKYPAMTAQFCFRAIEVIRSNYFEDSNEIDPESRRNEGWEKLRTELGYVREDFSEIEHFGIPNRHGVYPTITYAVRERAMNFTRELINKFVEAKFSISHRKL